MKFLKYLKVATVGLVALGISPAFSVITWEEPVNIGTGTGNSADVSTKGILVEAFNAALGSYGGGDKTVNGVNFVATSLLLDSDSSSVVDFSSATNGGDAAYDAILSTADFGGGDSTSIILGDGDGDSSVNGAGLLEAGDLYEIQVWFVDDRSGLDTRTMGYASSGADALVSLNDQYAIGTFTATGTTQVLYLDTVSPSSGFGNTHLTAYQIRSLDQGPVPTLSTSSDSVSGPFPVIVNFSEPVTGLEVSDFAIGNGSITPGSLAGGGETWSIEITPSGNGEVTVDLPAGTVVDLDGDDEVNLASNLLSVSYLAPGSDRPVAVLSTAVNPAPGPFSVELVFTEAVTGLEENDFQVSGGSVSGLTGAGTSYRVLADFTP